MFPTDDDIGNDDIPTELGETSAAASSAPASPTILRARARILGPTRSTRIPQAPESPAAQPDASARSSAKGAGGIGSLAHTIPAPALWVWGRSLAFSLR